MHFVRICSEHNSPTLSGLGGSRLVTRQISGSSKSNQRWVKYFISSIKFVMKVYWLISLYCFKCVYYYSILLLYSLLYMHFAGRIFEKKSQSMSNLFTFLNTIVMQTELLLHNYYLQLSVLMRSTQQLNLLA